MTLILLIVPGTIFGRVFGGVCISHEQLNNQSLPKHCIFALHCCVGFVGSYYCVAFVVLLAININRIVGYA